MANEFELKDWLAGLKLSDDERKVLEASFSKEENLKYVKESQLRQQDYSRKLNEFNEQTKKLQAEFQAKQQEVSAFQAELVDWQGKTQKQLNDTWAQKNKAEMQAKDIENRLNKIATDFGVDLTQYGANPTPTPANPTPANPATPPEESKWVSKEDFQKAVSDAQLMIDVSAEMDDLWEEHRDLFGKRLPGNERREILAQAKKERRPLVEIWQEKYKVQEKRQELLKKAQEEHDKKIIQETETRVRSELHLPAPRPEQAPPMMLNKQVMAMPKAEERRRGMQSRMNTVEAAMNALNSGKYAGQT